MKVVRLFLTMLSLATVVSASAQFSNAPTSQGNYNSNQTVPSASSTKVRPERNRDLQSSKLFVSYDVPSLVSNDKDVSSYSGSGFSLGYIRSVPVSGAALTIDVGGAFSFAKFTYLTGEFSEVKYDSDRIRESEDSYEIKYYAKYSSLSVPVSAAYHIKVNDKFSIVPFMGLNVRLGVAGSDEWKCEGTTYDGTDTTDYDESGSLDLFDDDDMGKEQVYTRLTLGYQIGFDLEFNKFYLGFNYNQDFVELNKYYRYRSSSIRMGLKF